MEREERSVLGLFLGRGATKVVESDLEPLVRVGVEFVVCSTCCGDVKFTFSRDREEND